MPADDTHRQARQGRAVQPPGNKSTTRKVLVFADRDRIEEIGSRLRPATHYEIVPASNPIGATTLSVRSGASLVIIDASVAGLPGGKLLQILRKHPRLSDIRIVLLYQGTDLEEVRTRYAVSQRDDVLSTAMLDSLLPIVERLFGPARGTSVPFDAVPSDKKSAP